MQSPCHPRRDLRGQEPGSVWETLQPLPGQRLTQPQEEGEDRGLDELFAGAFQFGESTDTGARGSEVDASRPHFDKDVVEPLARDPLLALPLTLRLQATHPTLQGLLEAMLIPEPEQRPKCRDLLRLPALAPYLSHVAQRMVWEEAEGQDGEEGEEGGRWGGEEGGGRSDAAADGGGGGRPPVAAPPAARKRAPRTVAG